jgi:hypothetical protein
MRCRASSAAPVQRKQRQVGSKDLRAADPPAARFQSEASLRVSARFAIHSLRSVPHSRALFARTATAAEYWFLLRVSP